MISETFSLELKDCSDEKLHAETLRVAKDEQEMTVCLLYHLFEVQRRNLFAKRGYGSLWSYVVEALGYSESQTFERISAMKLMFRDKSALTAIETGAITLTQAASMERFLRAEEKEKKEPVPLPQVRGLIDEVRGKSKRETEKILLAFRPSDPVKEKIRPVTGEISEVRLPVTEETREAMERYWELKGRCSVSELFSDCLTFYLLQKDPKRKKKTVTKTAASPAKLRSRSRYIPQPVKQEVRQRSEDRCEYVDKESNRRCESRYLLQFDHIHPYAWGGTSDRENIRQLCAVHNGYLAERMFAREDVGVYEKSYRGFSWH